MRVQDWIGWSAALVVAVASPAADEFGVEDIEPKVSRLRFAELLDAVQAEDDGRMIADLLFSDYASSLEALAERIDAAQVAAGRGDLELALAGQLLLDRDELRALRADVRRAEAGVFGEAEQAAEQLLTSVRDVLAADADVFERAARHVRRDMHLAGRRVRERDTSYAADGVDLVLLVEEARAGGELASVGSGEIDQILEQYAAGLDTVLRTSARRWWDERLDAAVADILDDADRKADAEREVAREWTRHWSLTQQYVDRIADASGGAGPAFRARFMAAAFPSLLRDTRPDRVNAWIQKRIDDSSVRADAEAVMAEFRGRRAPIVGDAIEIIVRSRADHGAMLDARMDPLALSDRMVRDLYQELLRNSGRRSSIESDATESLEALLTSRERKQMRADIAAAAFGRRR